MKFRKKPVVIEAVHYTGKPKNISECLEFCAGNATYWMAHDDFAIETLEGKMTVSPGDWIIKGVKGEFYPCKPDIFEATYEPVADAGQEG